MPQEIGLHSLKPNPGSRHPRKRVGRGEGSGLGKTSGRGEKGAGLARGAKSRPGFEGGQMPIHMRMRKLRGPHMKKSMPFENFRTHTQPVNLRDLEARFDDGAEVTPETLTKSGLATRKGVPVKILGQGELGKKLTVHAHAFSEDRAREDRGCRRRLHHPRRAKLGPCSAHSSTPSGSPDLRKKIAFTAAMLALYRLGAYIPAPGINLDAVKGDPAAVLAARTSSASSTSSRAAACPASRSSRSGSCPTSPPRSSCSCCRWSCPRSRSSKKEGEVGQQKITQYTRYLTVGLAFAQSIGYVFLFRSFTSSGQRACHGTSTSARSC